MKDRRIIPWMCLAAALITGSTLDAAEGGIKFNIRLGGGPFGTEEYAFQATASGQRLTGVSNLNQRSGPATMTQELEIGLDGSPVRYRLEAELNGQKQIMEAWREGDQYRMRASMGEQSKTESAPVRPGTIVLDNLIAGHFQVLLNSLPSGEAAETERWFLVPQRLLALKGKITRSTIGAGTLNGKSIQTRKYVLEFANLIEEIWAEAATNQLVRVYVPIQKVDMTRDGFIPVREASRDADAEVAGASVTVAIPSGALQLPATLKLPDKPSGKVPAVVLVHGSGPNDRDETIGPNKPFRDLANGLAASGIATLRYDKRTYAFKKQIDAQTLTLDQEVTDDAVAALEYCTTRPEIDASRIFLLGHSLGGTMAPLVARRFPALRGVILLAAAVRPLDELVLEQSAFQYKAAGLSDAETAKGIATMKDTFARVRSGEAADGEMIMFAPARYWREAFRLDPSRSLAEMRVPALVLQGGKDVQVRKADYDMIAKALGSSIVQGNELHWFPNLNHLFMEVEGEATGAEYGRAGNVSPAVISTISSWIRKLIP